MGGMAQPWRRPLLCCIAGFGCSACEHPCAEALQSDGAEANSTQEEISRRVQARKPTSGGHTGPQTNTSLFAKARNLQGSAALKTQNRSCMRRAGRDNNRGQNEVAGWRQWRWYYRIADESSMAALRECASQRRLMMHAYAARMWAFGRRLLMPAWATRHRSGHRPGHQRAHPCQHQVHRQQQIKRSHQLRAHACSKLDCMEQKGQRHGLRFR